MDDINTLGIGGIRTHGGSRGCPHSPPYIDIVTAMSTRPQDLQNQVCSESALWGGVHGFVGVGSSIPPQSPHTLTYIREISAISGQTACEPPTSSDVVDPHLRQPDPGTMHTNEHSHSPTSPMLFMFVLYPSPRD